MATLDVDPGRAQGDGAVAQDATDDDGAPPPSVGRRPKVGPVVARVVVALVVLLVLAAGWVAFRAWQAASALQDARALLGAVELDAASASDVAADLDLLHDATTRARAASTDPVWRAAELAPWAGDQLRAVRVVATSLDAVVADGLPAVDDLATLLDGGLRGADGRFDVVALRSVATHVTVAAATTRDARDELATLDPDALVGPLTGPVRQAQDAVARVDAALGPAAGVAEVLPAMLGADGPRTYLVLALNSAEARTAGGIVGSVVAVRADAGAVSIVDSRSTVDLQPLDEPVLPLTDEEEATWGPRLGRWVQNSVMTPEFPRTAELVAARWARDVGGTVDGVVATDPAAVAALLGATGPVPDPDGGTIDRATLVDVLLRDAYVRHPDQVTSDAFFSAVAATVVGAVADGAGDARELLRAARHAVDERRVRIWSARPGEQERLAATVVGGAFLSGTFSDQPGLFLDDATQGKLGAYLTTGVTFRDARCTQPDPTVTAVLRMELDPPADLLSMSPLVRGFPEEPVPPGTLLTTVSVWSAQDGPPLVTRRDTGAATGRVTHVAGRTVQQLASQLAPGQSQEIEVDLPLRDGAVSVWTTPTHTSPGVVSFRCP